MPRIDWIEWDSRNIAHATRHGCSVGEIEDVLRNRCYPTFFTSTRLENGEERRGYLGHACTCRRLEVVGVPLVLRGFRPVMCHPAESAAMTRYEAKVASLPRTKRRS